MADAHARVREHLRVWRIAAEHTVDGEGSILVFGTRDRTAVVLKVLKHEDEEWRSGEVLAAFDGVGTARVYEHVPGAMLLERLAPAESLISIAQRDDDEATRILSDVIARLRTDRVVDGLPTVQDWGQSFTRYLESGNEALDRLLVARAQRIYGELAASQQHLRLLHGDLHHENVLYDRTRGWLAIDPKGVIGEVEYELGAALRNPNQMPASFVDARLRARVDIFAERLGLDRHRIEGWAFSQRVLSAIWTIEDTHTP